MSELERLQILTQSVDGVSVVQIWCPIRAIDCLGYLIRVFCSRFTHLIDPLISVSVFIVLIRCFSCGFSGIITPRGRGF